MTADLHTADKRKRHEQAKLAGGEARRSGRKAGDNPYRGYTATVRALHYAWLTGWQDEDARARRLCG